MDRFVVDDPRFVSYFEVEIDFGCDSVIVWWDYLDGIAPVDFVAVVGGSCVREEMLVEKQAGKHGVV